MISELQNEGWAIVFLQWKDDVNYIDYEIFYSNVCPIPAENELFSKNWSEKKKILENAIVFLGKDCRFCFS